MNNLEVLRELTDKLPPVIPLSNGERVAFDLEKGISVMWKVWQDDDEEASIVRAENTRGTKFPCHVHDTHEFLIFYTGRAEIEFEDGAVLLEAPASFHIEPGRRHRLHYHTDCRLIAVFVPADPEVWSVRN